jgi:hypothetical protein
MGSKDDIPIYSRAMDPIGSAEMAQVRDMTDFVSGFIYSQFDRGRRYRTRNFSIREGHFRRSKGMERCSMGVKRLLIVCIGTSQVGASRCYSATEGWKDEYLTRDN